MAKLNADQIISKFNSLKGLRDNWENHWKELGQFFIPRKDDISTVRTPGEKRNQRLLDSTGLEAAESLAGGLHGFLTNPFAQWFELSTGDDELDQKDTVRTFLQKTAKIMLRILNNSNFQTEVHELYLDLVVFGTSSMSVEEDTAEVVRFRSYHIDDIFIEENSRGRIKTQYRKFRWSAGQIVQEFGEDALKNLSNVKKAFDSSDHRKFELVHAVYPLEDDPVLLAKEIMPFMSQYLVIEDKQIISEGRFREFPFVVPRWVKGTRETYGRSPAMKALPDQKTLNVMTETTLRGAQKVVDPPLQVPDDGFVLGGGKGVRTKPGSLNYYRAGTKDRIEPIFSDARIDFGFQAMADRRERIRQAFFTDQLRLLQGGPQMTATEVIQRTEDGMRLLGPMLGRQQAELLRPLIDRMFEIMLRRGLINEEDIPEELSGRRLDVQYSSLIAKAQRQSEVQSIVRTFEAIAPLAGIDPSILDNIDGDKFLLGVARDDQVKKTNRRIEGRSIESPTASYRTTTAN